LVQVNWIHKLQIKYLYQSLKDLIVLVKSV